jgi:alkylation response protein AidB-like acyl-CoA dehydrogenase
MLDLAFDQQQEMLRDVVRGLCATHAPLGVVRDLEDDPLGYPPELWKQLGALDLAGLLLPEQHGGAGMTLLEGVVVYEELGRSLAPSPHFVSCVLGGGLLAHGGSDEQQRVWLPRIASGEAIFSVAWLEPDGGFGPRGVQTTATRATNGTSDGWVLSGTKRHVAFARAAERLVVLARTGPEPADVDLFLVDPGADGVTLTQQHSVASDTQYRVDLDGAPGERLGSADGNRWAAWESVRDDALVLLGAWAAGAAAYAQEITVQYAKDREQFDKPLGAFQAIAHYLADRQAELDGARTLVHEAAWAASTGLPVARLAPMAKLAAAQMFRDLTATAQQIFGGVGFTLDYDIQLYFRRAKALQVGLWNDRYLEELIAADVLDG